MARVNVFWALGLFEWRQRTDRVGVGGLRLREEQIAPPFFSFYLVIAIININITIILF